MEQPRLTLYHRPSCSYCIQVRMVADRLGIPLVLCDASRDLESRQELLDATGRTTVPVLRITEADDTRWMRESLAIIRYLKAEAGQPAILPAWLDRLSSVMHTLSFIALISGLLAGGPTGRTIAIGGGVLFGLAVLRRIASVLMTRRVASTG